MRSLMLVAGQEEERILETSFSVIGLKPEREQDEVWKKRRLFSVWGLKDTTNQYKNIKILKMQDMPCRPLGLVKGLVPPVATSKIDIFYHFIPHDAWALL